MADEMEREGNISPDVGEGDIGVFELAFKRECSESDDCRPLNDRYRLVTPSRRYDWDCIPDNDLDSNHVRYILAQSSGRWSEFDLGHGSTIIWTMFWVWSGPCSHNRLDKFKRTVLNPTPIL
ncbi:uncharacterized protein LOC142350700 isoform X1 [Convolutriloba macropyga]|uniref:uncharacterized protein LOC142350700 isoform X1 n=2 Tax=Convolutriloba macropyga TaxID=536237 RepID=UPI003F520162